VLPEFRPHRPYGPQEPAEVRPRTDLVLRGEERETALAAIAAASNGGDGEPDFA